MSTYWGFHCKSCDDHSYTWMNHGEDELRAIAAVAPQLADLQRAYTGSYLELGWLGGYEWPLPPQWVVDHVGHEIELFNEYGHVEPISPSEPCPTESVGCTRKAR